jgi:hypothetical protein
MADDRMHDTHSRMITIEATPEAITIDTAKTAVLVVDMQNDFGTKDAMFDRAGLETILTRKDEALRKP